jgi:hypothetical protein
VDERPVRASDLDQRDDLSAGKDVVALVAQAGSGWRRGPGRKVGSVDSGVMPEGDTEWATETRGRIFRFWESRTQAD